MTWEETIRHIRTQPEYRELVQQAYFHEDLALNVRNYLASPEFAEILKLFRQHAPDARRILDIGCGNGITAIAFALNGYTVDAVEPDPSDTVGASAVRQASRHFNVSDKITVHQAFAEDIRFPDATFDIVFARQSMHHARDLGSFVGEMARTLKPGGLFLTVRDHVITDDTDMQLFLQTHPLHRFYGGENAFTAAAYKQAIANSGLQLIREIRFFDNILNYFPLDANDLNGNKRDAAIGEGLRKKLGFVGALNPVIQFYKWFRKIGPLTEADFPGRMYSYLATK